MDTYTMYNIILDNLYTNIEKKMISVNCSQAASTCNITWLLRIHSLYTSTCIGQSIDMYYQYFGTMSPYQGHSVHRHHVKFYDNFMQKPHVHVLLY